MVVSDLHFFLQDASGMFLAGVDTMIRNLKTGVLGECFPAAWRGEACVSSSVLESAVKRPSA